MLHIYYKAKHLLHKTTEVLHKKTVKTSYRKSVFEKILNVFAWFIFALALLSALISLLSSISNEKNGKEIFGYRFLVVASDSMSKSPLNDDESIYFGAGDLIIINSANAQSTFNEGDVITFLSFNADSYGKTLTHKIRKVEYSEMGEVVGYETYGIHTGVSDETLVEPEHVIGVYAGKIPNFGNVFSFLQTPRGYYLSILTPSVLLIIFFSIKVGRYFGEKATKSSDYDEEIQNLKERIEALESKINANALSEEQQRTDSSENVSLQEEKQIDYSPFSRSKKTSFCEKLFNLKEESQDYFNAVHNELTSYKKVKARTSFKCISYRKGKTLLAKMTVRGKTLKLHLALKVEDFNKNVYFQQDLSSLKTYREVPFTVKIKSNRAKNNAVKLIESLMKLSNVVKNPNYCPTDQIKILKSQLKTVLGGQENEKERT